MNQTEKAAIQKELTRAINKEIRWLKKHDEDGQLRDYKRGYVDGMKFALRTLYKIDNLEDTEFDKIVAQIKNLIQEVNQKIRNA